MSGIDFSTDDLLDQARGNQTAIWYLAVRRARELDGTVDERWRGDAFIGDEVTKPQCMIAEGGSVVWTTHQAHGLPPELARFDHDTGQWTRSTSFNDDVIADTVFHEVRTIRWTAPDGLEERLADAATGAEPFVVAGREVWVLYGDGIAGSRLATGFSRFVGVSTTTRTLGTVTRIVAKARARVGDPGS